MLFSSGHYCRLLSTSCWNTRNTTPLLLQELSMHSLASICDLTVRKTGSFLSWLHGLTWWLIFTKKTQVISQATVGHGLYSSDKFYCCSITPTLIPQQTLSPSQNLPNMICVIAAGPCLPWWHSWDLSMLLAPLIGVGGSKSWYDNETHFFRDLQNFWMSKSLFTFIYRRHGVSI